MSYYFSTTLFTIPIISSGEPLRTPILTFRSKAGCLRIPIRPNSARRSVCCRQSFCGSLSLRLFFSQGRSLRRFMFSFRGTFRTFVCLAFRSGLLLFSFAGDLPTGFRKSRFLRKFVPERKSVCFFIIRANEKIIFSIGLVLLYACADRSQGQRHADDRGVRVEEECVVLAADSPIRERIKTQSIHFSDYQAAFTTSGVVQAIPTGYAEIASPFAGRIVKSFVRLGQQVVPGSPVFFDQFSVVFRDRKGLLPGQTGDGAGPEKPEPRERPAP